MEKRPIFNQNLRLTPCKKGNFLTFKTSCFYSLEKRFFVVEYRKTDFPGLYYLKKKKERKLANF